MSTGAEKHLSAIYVVGADGANSKVRRIIDSGFTDFGATHRSLILDIEPFVQSDKLPNNLDAFIVGGIRNPLTYLSIAKGGLRFEEMLRPDDDSAEFESLPHIYDVLSPYLKPSEYRLWRAESDGGQAACTARGGPGACSSPATRVTQRRPTSVRACARGSGTPPTWHGSCRS